MSALKGSSPVEAVPAGGPVPAPAAPAAPRRGRETLYYAVHNKKLVFGLSLELVFVLLAIFWPVISPHNMTDFFASNQPPSGQHWLGTDNLGHDLFAEVVTGLQVSYLVGVIGALCAAFVGMALGFTAGWRGGLLDDVLQMITNIVIMIPALVLLIVIGAYLKTRGILFEGTFIGLTTWPWVARAVRAQTFTLKSREFVDLARLSGRRATSIVIKEIAPNMASYLVLVVILLFGTSMLLAANFDFLGLGPTTGTSLGNIMNQSTLWSALQLHYWWWFLPPGILLTGMVAALLIANVGLDEVFNPMEFRNRGFVKSVIAITHDVSILAQIADSILVMYAGRLAEKASAADIVNAPLHPYTQMLLASLPEVGVRYDKTALTGIPGRPPSLVSPPRGCRFADRCPFARAKCAEAPPFEQVGPGRQVASWKVSEGWAS